MEHLSGGDEKRYRIWRAIGADALALIPVFKVNGQDAADSVEMQWRGQAEFYSLMREHGVFVHAPDDYLFAGGANKECGGKPEDHPSKRRAGRPQEWHFVYRL